MKNYFRQDIVNRITGRKGRKISNTKLKSLLQIALNDYKSKLPKLMNNYYDKYLSNYNLPLEVIKNGKKFYKTKQWRALRIRAFAKYGRKCLCCGKTTLLHVDHVKPRSKYPELTLDLKTFKSCVKNAMN